MKLGIGGKLSIGGKIGGGVPISKVYYHIQIGSDTSDEIVFIENSPYLQDALTPKTFTPSTAADFEFYGWREDTNCTPEILSSRIVGINEEIHLYAIFRRTVTITYVTNNSSVTSTPPENQINYCYLYYDGTEEAAAFTLASAHTSNNSNYKFRQWAVGSSGGTLYNAGAVITLDYSTNIYARWYQAQTQSSSGEACGMNGTFRDGGTSTETVYYTTFISTPSISLSRNLYGWGPDHSNGGYGSVVSVGTSSATLKLVENDNSGNNYNYRVALGWTATGKRWVAV